MLVSIGFALLMVATIFLYKKSKKETEILWDAALYLFGILTLLQALTANYPLHAFQIIMVFIACILCFVFGTIFLVKDLKK